MEKNNGKIKQERIMTALVGSYPKPKTIFPDSGRSLLDVTGMTFYYLKKEIGAEEFETRLDQAALMAIEDQNSAGIEWITDGEERRGHYVLYVLRKLRGIDFTILQNKTIRDGKYVRKVPVVTGKIDFISPILVDDFLFTQKHARGIAKIGLPGPMTVTDGVADAYYKDDREAMAMDYARAIHPEVKSLIDAGCQAIQFDDPVLLRYPDQAKKWGLKALHACFEGFENQATFFVHVCRGYPDPKLEKQGIEYKANENYYHEMLSWFSESNLDIISIEGSQEDLDLSILPALGKKTIMLGVLDIGSESVESVELLVKRGQEALQFIPLEQLILAPDCGMIELSRTSAHQKLMNLSKATAILNERV